MRDFIFQLCKSHISQTQISRNFWESSPPPPLRVFSMARRVMTPVTVYSNTSGGGEGRHFVEKIPGFLIPKSPKGFEKYIDFKNHRKAPHNLSRIPERVPIRQGLCQSHQTNPSSLGPNRICSREPTGSHRGGRFRSL